MAAHVLLPPVLAGAPLWRLGAVALLVLVVGGLAVALRASRRHAVAPAGLLAHVAELRNRILWGLGAWTTATLLVLAVRVEATSWGVRPVLALHDNLAAQAYRALARLLVPDNVQLVVLRPLDGFNAELTVALALGFCLALPVLWWQLASFIGPALRPTERRMLRLTLLPAVALFSLGATFAVAILAPLLLETLYGYPGALGAQPFLLVGDLVSFAVTLGLMFGLASLTPLAMGALARAGLVGWRGFLGKWRHAVLATLVLCAFVTDGTLVTLVLVTAPLVGLYFVGVALAAWMTPRTPPSESRLA